MKKNKDFKMKKLTLQKEKLLRAICISFLIVPMLYSIYYSVPASDDFSMALGRSNSNGFFSELFSNCGFFFTKRGGAIVAFFLEFLINPLNAHVHLGHLYGLYMIAAFLLATLAVVYFLSVLTNYILPNLDERLAKTTQVIVLAVLYSTYYYSEAYNWFVGVIAYELHMVMTLLTFAFIIRWSQTEQHKYFILMIITGIVAANNYVFDIPLGLFYLYAIYYKAKKKTNLHNALPLLCMIASGCVCVLAPGNFVRKSQYVDASGPSFVRICIQVCIDIAERTFRIIVDHPFTVVLFIALVLVGIVSNYKARENTPNILLVFILGLLAQAGSLLPYVYARGFTTTYVDIRVQYVMDYFIELNLCATCILIGRYIAHRVQMQITGQTKVATAFALALFIYASVINNYGYLEIAQVGILKEHSTITASYNYWNGILTEIESSDESDLVIERDYSIAWSEYFFAPGIDSGEVYDDDPSVIYSAEHIMPNVYYQKDSLVVNFPEAEE